MCGGRRSWISGFMLQYVLFVALASAAIASAVMVFESKHILHVMVSFAAFSVVLAFILAYMSLPLLGLLQLFIMVGGVSTYMFVGVSSESLSNFRFVRAPVLAALALLLFAVIAYRLLTSDAGFNGSNLTTPLLLGSTMSGSMPVFYIIAALLLFSSIGSILLMRKLVDDE